VAHGVGSDGSCEAVHGARFASVVQRLDDPMEANLATEVLPYSWSCCGLKVGMEAEVAWDRHLFGQGCADGRLLLGSQSASSCGGFQETTLSDQGY
jgi:hypothetical protein